MKKEMRVPQWTTIYHLAAPGRCCCCWHIEWGHKNGPPLPLRLIMRLSRSYYKEHRVERSLSGKVWIIPATYKKRYDCRDQWIHYTEPQTKNQMEGQNT
jgi:hypothetical protein